jgi:hypothetical protein
MLDRALYIGKVLQALITADIFNWKSGLRVRLEPGFTTGRTLHLASRLWNSVFGHFILGLANWAGQKHGKINLSYLDLWRVFLDQYAPKNPERKWLSAKNHSAKGE